MKIKIYSKSITGKEKENNQDYYFWGKNPYQQIIIGVADGVGSYKQSGIISKVVSETIKEEFYEKNFDKLEEAEIKKWLQNIIDQKIRKKISQISQKIATTLSMVIINEQKSYLCHIGNTRIYQFDQKKSKMHLLTQDHEVTNKTEDTFAWIMGNKLLRNSISNYSSCYIDVAEIVNKKGYLLLTSDGLHNFVKDDFLYETIKNDTQIEKEKMELFFEKAIFGGSLDDITCLLVKIN